MVKKKQELEGKNKGKGKKEMSLRTYILKKKHTTQDKNLFTRNKKVIVL